MNITNVTDDYDTIKLTSFTNTENEDNNNFFKKLFLSIPRSIIWFSLLFLIFYTLIKPLINNK